ncbi:MAG TPA: adenosylcobinamide-phosphate synthase CbiB [Bradyrhizobium sp.]|nr:adenosylcobinamide-phosphate synthase CbiB [Bradyrhizobium sp.]
MAFAGAMAVAMVMDALVGWPGALLARIGHPVTWLGRLIAALDTQWNREMDAPSLRRTTGIAAALLVIALAAGFAWIVQRMIPAGLIGIVILGILAWPFVAFRSLYDHVAAVRDPLRAGDVEAARKQVAMIVGRDPSKLDEAGIARAAIESLSENASDGIVAPIFWGALFGLPGIVGYKAINTLDSMIGHRSERHRFFGWAAARIDDVANFLPARLTGLLFVVLAGSTQRSQALSCMWQEARHHRSINAGWPEAAMAGALGVRLCGPRFYDDELADEPWLNGAAGDPAAADITKALELYVAAMFALTLLLVVLAVV